MFSDDLIQRATAVLAAARAKGLKIVTAESCTGGLIAGLLTEIAGSSDVFERGFVTYSNESKTELLGVPAELIRADGAVSNPVARAMAQGALRNSRAHLVVSVTGIAGPSGGTETKPVGLVYIATIIRLDTTTSVEFCGVSVAECRFGNIGRDQVRIRTVEAALALLSQLV